MDLPSWGATVTSYGSPKNAGVQTETYYNVPTPMGPDSTRIVGPPITLVGVKNATLLHQEANYNGSNQPLTMGTPFTVSIFDTATRADFAQILLHNGSTNTMVILASCIRGQGIRRISGDNGLIHDKYVNYESIAQDGDIVFELAND
jgi:hypothetical protein